MQIPWLKPVADSWASSRSQGRPPHALMLAGTVGTGKRCAAAWLARQSLGLQSAELPEYPLALPEHADLRWLAPLEDKHTIGIDQVRQLVAELSLTSYEGGSKVAIVEPADAMTTSAANSLLKTLEEPPGDTLLILIVDRPGHLPATIFSRCQRLNIGVPGEAEGLSWLQALQPAANWATVLRESGFAPLAALRALERLDETDAMASEFAAVAEGRAAPLQVAAKWARLEPEFVLDWLSRQVQTCISRASGGSITGVSAVVADSVLKRIDRRKLFCYLDIINRLRGQPKGSFNVQLTLECLLIDWSQRLESLMGTE
jgi:DNA polymerase-3 subunit delta'